MQNTTLFNAINSKKQVVSKLSNNNVIIMDEVDGMAGNEDKGGLNALLNIVKTTKMPIICICNNRNNQKLKSLIKYCYEIKFTKPDKNMSIQMLKQIITKEKMNLSMQQIESILEGSNYDFRQCMNVLESLKRSNCITISSANDKLKLKDKNLSLTPFEASKIFLSKYEVSLYSSINFYIYK